MSREAEHAKRESADHWTRVDGLLSEAQEVLDEMLRSAKQHILDARGDIYADLK